MNTEKAKAPPLRAGEKGEEAFLIRLLDYVKGFDERPASLWRVEERLKERLASLIETPAAQGNGWNGVGWVATDCCQIVHDAPSNAVAVERIRNRMLEWLKIERIRNRMLEWLKNHPAPSEVGGLGARDDALLKAAEEALLALGVFKVTDAQQPYVEVSSMWRRQMLNAHDLLEKALSQVPKVASPPSVSGEAEGEKDL